MIDTSKLKYYKELCEKDIIDEQQKDLDGIMNTLEEKQFEYLKRLETNSDEDRKDEINEIINIVDMQLKELTAIKTTVNSGIIVADALDKDTTKNPFKQTTEAKGYVR